MCGEKGNLELRDVIFCMICILDNTSLHSNYITILMLCVEGNILRELAMQSYLNI